MNTDPIRHTDSHRDRQGCVVLILALIIGLALMGIGAWRVIRWLLA